MGSRSFCPSRFSTPAVLPQSNWSALSVGDRHSCGIANDGSLDRIFCHGSNREEQLKPGLLEYRIEYSLEVHKLRVFDRVSAGAFHTCGIATDTATRKLKCWGDDTNNQVGGFYISTGDYAEVAAGHTHTCAIDTTGVLWCWGDNTFGQLGAQWLHLRAGRCPDALRQRSGLFALALFHVAELEDHRVGRLRHQRYTAAIRSPGGRESRKCLMIYFR